MDIRQLAERDLLASGSPDEQVADLLGIFAEFRPPTAACTTASASATLMP
jgi:hypothetical protein